MTPAQYIQWMDEHGELETWESIKMSLEDYIAKFKGSHDSADCEILMSLGDEMLDTFNSNGNEKIW